jgi:UDP-N-acetylmuramyl tripeptide synthase
MKMISKALAGAAFLALAACGGQGDDTAGDNVAQAYENQADQLEMMADNTTNEMQADSLENQADQLEETGEAKEEAIDRADINATNAQ